MHKRDWLVAVGGAVTGASIAAVAARSSGRAAMAVATAFGASVGAAAAAFLSPQPSEPWWHDEANVRTFEDVARDDANFREAAAKQSFDAVAEAEALQRLLSTDSESHAKLVEACATLKAEARLAHAMERWQPWRGEPLERVGAAVHAVVTELEAPHLQPSGIERRLCADGVAASCFGLFTLMNAEALARG